MSERPIPALFTDLYQLTMLQAYHAEGMTRPAVFELFVRRLPPARNFLIACGLAEVLNYLEHLAFTASDLAYLETLGYFQPAFLDWLRTLRFTGNVYALREGTPFFPNEPILAIEAPLPEAQLIETAVLNLMHYPTLVASKGVRVVEAAGGRGVVDFGARRTHGVDAALACARALTIAGYAGTSNVDAGRQLGIPVVGTMAHSYIQAHASEEEAFIRFAQRYPGTTLLVDTYDTLEGVRQVIALSRRLGENFQVGAIRLDSGDLAMLARESRALLDAAGPCAGAHRGQRQPGRISGGRVVPRRCAHRQLWRRDLRGRGRRRPEPGGSLQAGGLCGEGLRQAVPRQGEPARSQAGVPSFRGWLCGGGYDRPQGRGSGWRENRCCIVSCATDAGCQRPPAIWPRRGFTSRPPWPSSRPNCTRWTSRRHPTR